MSVRILVGDVFARLAELPDNHFDCVLSSPPYWGLRSYLDADHPDKHLEIGCEPTLGEHLDVLLRVMREIRRVLKPTGVCWINYGDRYATSPNGRSAADTKAAGQDDRTFRDKPFSTVGPIRGGPPSDKSTLRGNGHVGGGPKLKSLPPAQLRGPTYEIQPESRQNARRGRSGNLGNGGINGVNVPDGRVVAGGYLKPKDLCMIPQRLAIALQEDGWWVRSLMPWVKRNGMPESISDRPASSIEYVIMLTKSARYAYDAEAVRRPSSDKTNARVSQKMPDGWDTGAGGHGSFHRAGREKGKTTAKQDATAAAAAAAGGASGRRMSGFNERWDAAGGKRRPKAADANSGIRSNDSFEAATSSLVLNDRNFRNSDLFFDSLEPPFGLIHGSDGLPIALDVCPQGFKEAHFATFPEALALPLLKAGCPERVCSSCGAPWARLSERVGGVPGSWNDHTNEQLKGHQGGASAYKGADRKAFEESRVQTVGWESRCRCEGATVSRGRVLDPFGGAGTVGLVADRLGMDSTLIELNPESAAITRRRINYDAGMFSTVETFAAEPTPNPNTRPRMDRDKVLGA